MAKSSRALSGPSRVEVVFGPHGASIVREGARSILR